MHKFRLWLAIHRAKRQIKEFAQHRCPGADVLSKTGAIHIDPRHLAIWITTKTDEERDSLRRDLSLYQQLCNALLRAGYPADAVPLIHFSIESQETVDREYGGHWSEAIEMP